MRIVDVELLQGEKLKSRREPCTAYDLTIVAGRQADFRDHGDEVGVDRTRLQEFLYKNAEI